MRWLGDQVPKRVIRRDKMGLSLELQQKVARELFRVPWVKMKECP